MILMAHIFAEDGNGISVATIGSIAGSNIYNDETKNIITQIGEGYSDSVTVYSENSQVKYVAIYLPDKDKHQSFLKLKWDLVITPDVSIAEIQKSMGKPSGMMVKGDDGSLTYDTILPSRQVEMYFRSGKIYAISIK